MRALVIAEKGNLTFRNVAPPEVDGECVIDVTLAGICGTDLQLVEGYAGFTGIPGHEFVGVVRHAPAGDAQWVGKRVVGEINVGCGRCDWCQRGVKEHCLQRTVVGIRGRPGAFADRLTLPARNLYELPDSMDDATAVFVEPVAAACRIFEQVDVSARTRLAVVGDGRLGILTAQVMRTRSRHVVLLGRHERKVGVARDLGIDARLGDDMSRGNYDIVIEATGRPEGLGRAMELVRPRGTIVLKSTFHGESTAELWPAVVHEVTLVGSRCGPFGPALALLASGAVLVGPLVSGRFPLDAHAAAFAAARRELKVLFAIAKDAGSVRT